ncbi:hypothetical protein ACFP56_07150 [Paenibacillus septentrionalis]|uniref:DUF3951 domain-containing protein n=1 Tax=Paenibacillus septentrionalis TaxID=429342 RepID=A0ABW1V1S0_9BACL
MRTSNLGSYIVLLLIAIGIIVTLINHPLYVIIPVVLFGIIYYCIKRPPAFLSKYSKPQNNYRSAAKQSKAKKERSRSKTIPFKVIEGGRDDNDTPRYH